MESETLFQSPTTTEFKSYFAANTYEEGLADFTTVLNLHSDVLKINRKTDSLLDWLGDWGGLLDGLNLIVELFLESLSFYALKSRLAGLTFRSSDSKKAQDN